MRRLLIPSNALDPLALEALSSILHSEIGPYWLYAVMESMVLMPHTLVPDRDPLPDEGGATLCSGDNGSLS